MRRRGLFGRGVLLMLNETFTTGTVYSNLDNPGHNDWCVALYKQGEILPWRHSFNLTERGALRIMDKWSKSGQWRA